MKTKKKNLFIQVLFATLVFVFTLGLASCEEEKPVDYGEKGVYYFDAEVEEYLLTLSSGNSVSLYIDGEDVSGAYVCDGTNLTFTFDGEETVSATLSDNVITMEYDDASYRFLKKIKYSVTYDLDGGEGVENGSVVNGKTLAKPVDPTKEGYKFVGWYEDEEFTKPFAFDATPVLSNITLYACYVPSEFGQSEYTVTFVNGDTVVATAETKGGILFDMEQFTPTQEGATFLGWWTSDYEDATKLTTQYTGQVLDENTTLYAVWQSEAPAISVTSSGVSWKAQGATNTYKLTITNANGTVLADYESSASTYAYNFAAQPAGDYMVNVTVNGTSTATAYYKNKALARVSHFYVSEPSMLIFEGVEHAEKYLITVVCGDSEHSHVAVENGLSTNYPFANCEMKEGGIEFTVQAVANGYATSTSATFRYEKKLDPVAEVEWNEKDGEVIWSSVRNATSYLVKVGEDEYTVKSTSFSTKRYAGDVTVSVTPMAKGYNSPEAKEISYTNDRLAAPTNVAISYQTITWDQVEGAERYVLSFGAKSISVTENRYELQPEDFDKNVAEYEISVQAIAANEANNSYASDACVVKNNEISVVRYNAGVLSWNPVVGAYRFGVSVNGGAFEKTATGATSAPVVLTQAGWNTVSLCFYDDYEIQSASVSISVYAYEITLSWEGGNADGEAANVVYRAVGDPMDLPVDGTRRGYDFAGWYNIPGGPANGGAKAPAEQYAANAIYYANWTPEQYTVKLMLDLETVYAEETVSYRQRYKFATTEPTDPTMTFGGWYTAMNRKGTQLTDANGNSYAVWNTIPEEGEELKVYVGWLEAVDYVLNADGTSYSAMAGGAISKVSTVRITATRENPDTGEVLPVTEIKSEGFAVKSSLRTIYFPDTIKTLNIGADGANGAGSPFRNCLNLENIYVYCANEAEHDKHIADGVEGMYFDIDGVLFYENPNEAQKTELLLVPLGRKGSYTIPAEVPTTVIAPEKDENGDDIPNYVDTLPVQAFYNTKLTELVIPWTITKIDANAFKAQSSSYASLETIIFQKAPGGETEKPLQMASGVFAGNTKLTSITLPARISELNLDPTSADFVFKGCSALAAIYINGEVAGQVYKSTQDGVLLSADEKTIIYCPVGREGTYTIPTGVKKIGEYAFYKCTKITEVKISFGVEEIADSAFDGCSGITKLEFEGTVDDAALTICSRAFYSCSGLTYVKLPENLATLEQFAFGGCTKLVKVDVYSVGAELDFEAGAFLSDTDAGTAYVQELYLSQKTGIIEINGVFGSKVKSVTIADGNEYYEEEGGVVFNKAMTEIVYYPTAKEDEKYAIPNTVTSIGAGVFQGKTFLTEITIPASVTSIGDYAFASSTKLQKVDFLSGGTAELNIGNFVFYSCSALTEIDLPERTRKIGTDLFHSCRALTEVVIPEGVTELGDYAFEYASALKKVTFPSTLVKLGYVVEEDVEVEGMRLFNYANNLETIIVHKDNTAYRTIGGVLYGLTDGEPTVLYAAPIMLSGDVVVPATVNRIWDKAFYNNARVTSVTFADAESGETTTPDEGETTTPEAGEGDGSATAPATPVFTLGANVFYNCISLVEVELPEGIEEISKQTFYNCDALTSVSFPSTVTLIDSSAFSGCENIEEIMFAEGGTQPLELGLKTGSAGIFKGFKKLTKVVLPERTTVIGEYAFADCYALSEINLPANLTYIGEAAFQRTNLGDVVLPDGVTYIGGYAFMNAGLTSLYIGSELEMIGEGGSWGNQQTFADNIKLTTVTFSPNSKMKYFSGESFRGCRALTKISLPATLETIKSNNFKDCTSLTEVIFLVDETTQKASLKTIDSSTFQNAAFTYFAFPESTSEITIAKNVFRGCRQLEEIYLSTSVTTYGDAFEGIPGLKRISVAPNHPNFAQPDQNATMPFMFDVDNKVIVKAYGEMKGVVDLSQLPITGIGENAFASQVTMTKIILPETLEMIDGYAFYNCYNLQEIQFADTTSDASLLTIDEYAFQYCKKLTSVTIPESVTTIGKNCFQYSGLTSITVPASVKTIGNYAFSRCDDLASATINNKTVSQYEFAYTPVLTSINLANVTSIGNSAFAESGLTSVTVPASVTTMGTSVFSKCASLATATVLNNAITNYEFQNCTALTTVNAASATTIGNYAFSGCTALKTTTFGTLTSVGNYAFKQAEITSIDLSSVKTLGNYAFQDATSLRSVMMSESIKKIDKNTFDGCTSLTSIDLSKVEEVAANAFDGCSSLATIDLSSLKKVSGSYAFRGLAITSLTLPDTLTTVNTYMFADCTSLKTIDVQGKLTGNYMFKGCTALTSVTVPSHWTTVGTYLFQDCTGITSITFDNVKTSNGMFKGCTGLTSVTLPATVTTVGTNLFQGCTGLTSVTVGTKTVSNYMFEGCTGLKTVDLSSVTSSFKSASAGTYLFQNCTNLTSVTLPASATTLPNYMFKGCTSLTTVNYPTITTLGTNVFNGCTNLQSAKFGKVTTITANCFQDCTSLTSFDLTNVTTINGSAFQNSGLTSVTIPASVMTINATNPFSGCLNLMSFAVDAGNANYVAGPNGELCKADKTIIAYPAGQSGIITLEAGYTIARYAFEGCNNITGINLPSDMKEIPDYAFQNVKGLVKINVPASVELIGYNAFSNASALREIVFAENSKLTEVRAYAFQNTALVRVSFPDTVTRWGYTSATSTSVSGYVFYGSKSLEYVKLPAHITDLGNSTFYNCEALTTVILPEDLTIIGTNFFYNCKALTALELPENLLTIKGTAFKNSGVQSLVIPASVQEIGGSSSSDAVFQGSELKEVTFEGVPSILLGKYLFYKAEKLEKVNLPEGWERIEDYMFQGASSLKSIDLPSTVNYFGSYAFSGTAFTEFVIPDSVVAFGYFYTFKDCVFLEKVTFGAGVSEIGYDMFSGCTAMKEIYISADRYVSNSAFQDWTEEQTIYIAVSEYEAASWTSGAVNGWLKNCNAKVVYNYVPTEGSNQA